MGFSAALMFAWLPNLRLWEARIWVMFGLSVLTLWTGAYCYPDSPLQPIERVSAYVFTIVISAINLAVLIKRHNMRHLSAVRVNR